MAADEKPPADRRHYREATRAVHLPDPPALHADPVGLPVVRSSTFAFETAQQYADVLGGLAPGFSYARVDAPTAAAFAAAVASLEGAYVDGDVVAEAFASGMAAITAVVLAVTGAGTHVVAPAAVYGGTWSLLARVLSRFGVETTFVQAADQDAVAAAIRPTTRLVWAETIANPTLDVADIPRLAGTAHDAGAVLAVDSTFASPVLCRPLEFGADLVVHSATKYLGGHSDATGGVVIGRPDLVSDVRAVRIDTGGVLAADEAFLLHRGLATLPLRMERQCASALTVADALRTHPAVARVLYPGLPDHPGHELASRLFDAGRYGGCITVTPRGGLGRGAPGREAGMAFCDGLRLAKVAASLGGHHTLVSHAATTTHRQLDDAALSDAGIDPGAVRISIGLEDPADLVTDITAALDRLG